ncbi:hypothetical protein GCM10028802_19660 [Terrabacter terrigena]
MPAVKPAASAAWTSRRSRAGSICSCEQWNPMTVMPTNATAQWPGRQRVADECACASYVPDETGMDRGR